MPDNWELFGWLRLRLLPEEVYGARAFVAPAFRGQRLHSETCKFSFSHLAGEGVTRFVTFIEALNRSSLRADVVHPRRYIGRIAYIRLLGFVIYRTNRGWSAGFWNKSRPRELWLEAFDRGKAT